MHLKFPLPVGYFPRFELTPDETLAYKELVTDIVKDTRREYESYVRDGQRQVDPRTWKAAKSKDRLHIYKRRSEFGAAPVGLIGHNSGSSHGSSGSGYSHSSFDMGLRSGSESSNGLSGLSISSRDEAAPPQPKLMTPGFTSPATFLLASGLKSKEMKDHQSNGGGSMSSMGSRSRVSSSGGFSSRGSATPHDALAAVDETGAGGLRRLLEPTLLAVGVLDGTVDDIIYALNEPTNEDMRHMASFIGDDSLIDCAVLHTIKSSKTTFLGLKWKLLRTPGGNRDLCFVEYVGVANDSKGQRYGFRVVESVKLRHCPAFPDNSIIRSDVSFCYLFRDSGTPGIVDVYMQGAFDSSADAVTAGGVGDARSTMELLLSVETAMDRAEARKLAELIEHQAAQPPRRQQGGTHCSICRSKPGLLSSHLLCQGCGAVICTKCRMKKTILSKKGSKQKVSCCKICLVNVKEKSPFEGEPINQKQELKALQRKPQATTPSTSSASSQDLVVAAPGKLERQRTGDSFAETEYSASIQSWQSSSVSSSYSDLDDSYGSYSPNTVDGGQLVVAKMPAVMETTSGGGNHYHHHQPPQLEQYAYGEQSHQLAPRGNLPPPPPAGYAPHAAPPMGGHHPQQGHAMHQHRNMLYNQMLELQMQAEKAYTLANQNAAFMQQRQ